MSLSVNQALAYTISPRSKPGMPIFFLTFAAVVFRAELAVYLAIFSLTLLLRRKVSLVACISNGAIAGILSLCKSSITITKFNGLFAIFSVFTLSIDSYFWQRWPMWPELQGIIFNVIEGKSSDWGVSTRLHFASRLLIVACDRFRLFTSTGPHTYQSSFWVPCRSAFSALSWNLAVAHSSYRL